MQLIQSDERPTGAMSVNSRTPPGQQPGWGLEGRGGGASDHKGPPLRRKLFERSRGSHDLERQSQVSHSSVAISPAANRE